MGSYWWLAAIIVLLLYAFLRREGERVVERRTGRQPKPDKFIFYAGIYVPVMLAIVLSMLLLSPDSGPLVFLITFCVAETIASMIAQSFFGSALE